MKVLDLFSGIGGFSLGLERAGMTTVGFCEIEPFCRAVLAKHWPGVPCHDDIRTLDATEFAGRTDLVCGGFPCQQVSCAGKGEGIGTEEAPTDRSGLWYEMLRVVREVRPRWVLAENVGALRLRGSDDVLSGLEREGYACWPLVVGAWAVGAPHRRDRVWIVANRPERGQRTDGAHSGTPDTLTSAARLWPTIRQSDWDKAGAKPSKGTLREGYDTLGRMRLSEAIRWPTATARDYKSTKASEATHERSARPLSEVVGRHAQANPSTNGKPHGSLNSTWVAQLQGYPSDWCELDRLTVLMLLLQEQGTDLRSARSETRSSPKSSN